MGFFRPYDSTGEPCFFEVYGSSTRLAFSRYFVVAHVDGFLYVLDKYFCISRLVPPRGKQSSSILTSQARRSGLHAGSGPPTRGSAQLEAVRSGDHSDGRLSAPEQQQQGFCGYKVTTEEDQLEERQLLVPVRIADVISALFRTNKPVFSQLFTGNNQYDQRQLQGLRQKSLLLSNRHDGCLYLFIHKFLLRVSLRGTVTVIGDLLELALAAANRLRVSASQGPTSGRTAAYVSSSNHVREDDRSERQGYRSPGRSISSVRKFFREIGHDKEAPSSDSDAILTEHPDSGPKVGSAAGEGQELVSPCSDDAKAQMWKYLRSMRNWLSNTTEKYRDSLSTVGRLQEFVACRGENWEVNNCCIDGEGRCFYTMARSKYPSPVEERGMVFCLDTKGPISRAMVVRFGRGITQSAVISLSLQAHPNCGCILMVAKSAAEVRNGLHSPDISASPSSATDCFPPRGIAVGTAISGRHTEGDSRMNRTSLGSAVGEADTLPPRSTVSGRHGCSEVPSASAESMTRRRSENAVHPSSDNSQARTSALQQESGDEATGDSTQDGRSGQGTSWPSTNNSFMNRQPPNQSAAPRESRATPEEQETSKKGQEGAADEKHSAWWFCPCDEDPSFFFPVAECFGDDAIHNAAQSVCRQFRGSPSSSVCRAYFEDDGGVALREAKAAVTAARTAELMIMATIQAGERRNAWFDAKHSPAFSVESTEEAPRTTEQSMRNAAARVLKEAGLAASRAERAESSGYILWQPGVMVRRPKTGEEAISFGSAILFRARTKSRSQPTGGWISGSPRPMQPPFASDLITGDLVAVISQDARHLEVRDAFPSPLGLIVVPAEAANRIIRQQPDGILGRITSRSNMSLTSFLASFIAGSSSAAAERETQAGVTTPLGEGSPEDAQQFAAEVQLTESALAGSMTSAGAYTNGAQDSTCRRAVPAVNIVFLVDTLRLCRPAEARPVQGSWGHNCLQTMSDQRLLGLTETATGEICEKRTCESSQRRTKNEKKREQRAAALGDKARSDAVTQSASGFTGGNTCLCRETDGCLGDPPTPVLHSHFADVTLLCADGFEVSSHRALLAARCSFFEAKLTRPHWEARGADKVVIDLRSFAGSVVQATVRFFETGYFVIPASCCCPHCCVEQRRNRCEQYNAPQQKGLPPYESQCCCKVDWVLQAYTFATYCIIQDLRAELLAVLARLTSQRTCLHVLTHPAVRNQRQILQLAAHQLVYHMPMPDLLLEVSACRKWGGPPADSSPRATERSPVGEGKTEEQKARNPLLAELLREGIYDAVVKALSAWVLVRIFEGLILNKRRLLFDRGSLPTLQVSYFNMLEEASCSSEGPDTHENIVLLSKLHCMGNCDMPSSRLRHRQLLVLLALRLLQESVTAPPSAISHCRGQQSTPYNLSRISRISTPEEIHSIPESGTTPWQHFADESFLIVPLRTPPDLLRFFLFRDVVLLWAEILDVPEEDAKVVAQAMEYSRLP